MNIQQAKKEILLAFRAYNRKDARGRYCFDRIRQRPILLIGPPGIGKTAIMEQIAEEAGCLLAAYTMTHHTRQSAVGLPRIEERSYEGKSFQVTEYTMSEIIASVYDLMEKTGKKEGILFIDEINCVSETLAPTMLQLLQSKAFGNHRLPEGWILAAAGNPPQYNKSVRDFDMATLDRVRRIEVEPDLDSWMAYAQKKRIHPSVRSYLMLNPGHFYYAGKGKQDLIGEASVREGRKADRISFVTARGWEDLSAILYAYEEMEEEVGAELVHEYLQNEEISRSFCACYRLYRQYGRDYEFAALLEDSLSEAEIEKRKKWIGEAGLDERFLAASMLADGICSAAFGYADFRKIFLRLRELLIYTKEKEPFGCLIEARKALRVRREAGMMSGEADEIEIRALDLAQDLMVRSAGRGDDKSGSERLRLLFREQNEKLEELAQKTKTALDTGFAFMEQAFGEGGEMAAVVSTLTHDPCFQEYICVYGHEKYLQHASSMLYRQEEKKLRQECEDYLKR